MDADERGSMEKQANQLIHSELTEEILGVYYDAYSEIGHGFLESVYNNCMYLALTKLGLSVRRDVPVPVYFRGQDVGQFKADLVVGGSVLIELKAVQNLDRTHEAQVMNYLRATELEVGLLLNFGSPKLQFRRIVFQNSNKEIRVNPRVSAVGGL
jgi:GxxExxY protein